MKPQHLKERIRKKKIKEIAYIITDRYFPDLEIKYSDNAWWMDTAKVERLIEAFKIDAGVMEACVYAGITHDQWQYFIEKHPNFSTVKQLCSELPCLEARRTVVEGIRGDKDFALKYLERKKREEFNTSKSEVDLTVNTNKSDFEFLLGKLKPIDDTDS